MFCVGFEHFIFVSTRDSHGCQEELDQHAVFPGLAEFRGVQKKRKDLQKDSLTPSLNFR